MDNSELKIGFDAKRAFYNKRGLGNYSRETIRILKENAPSNKYFLFTPKSINSLDFIHKNDCKIIEPKGIYKGILSSAWRTFGQCSDIKKLDLDIYHGLSHELPYGINKCNTKTVVTMHDLIFLKNPELFPFFDRYTFKKKYIDACNVANRIIAISNQTKDDLIEHLNIDTNKIDIVYQGCNPIFNKKILDHEKLDISKKYNLPQNFMLIVCAIEKRKNHETILHAMNIAKNKIPLVIVGRSSDYKKELYELINKYNLSDSVIFLHNEIGRAHF